MQDGTRLKSELFVLATGYKGPDHLLQQLFGEAVAKRVGRVWGFDEASSELRNMWTRTPQPACGSSAARSRRPASTAAISPLQIAAIEAGKLNKAIV